MTGLIRIIILGILLGLAMAFLRKFQQNRMNHTSNKSSARKNKPKSTTTVRCEQCGVYVPSNEAIRDDDKNYCCQRHKELHQMEQDQ